MDTIVKELRDCAATLSRIADMLAKQEQPLKAAAPPWRKSGQCWRYSPGTG